MHGHTLPSRRGCGSQPSPVGTPLGDTGAQASVKEKDQCYSGGNRRSCHTDWTWILLHLGIFAEDHNTHSIGVPRFSFRICKSLEILCQIFF